MGIYHIVISFCPQTISSHHHINQTISSHHHIYHIITSPNHHIISSFELVDFVLYNLEVLGAGQAFFAGCTPVLEPGRELEAASKIAATLLVLGAVVTDVDIAARADLRAFISYIGSLHSAFGLLLDGVHLIVVQAEDER